MVSQQNWAKKYWEKNEQKNWAKILLSKSGISEGR
jgi:hypothetical protein